MFARFKTPEGSETNINVSLIRDFSPGTVAGQVRVSYLGGDVDMILGTCRSVRHAVKIAVQAMNAGTTEVEEETKPDKQDDAPEDKPEA